MKYELSDLIITKINFATAMYNEKGASGKREDRRSWTVFIRYEGETVYRQNGRELISNIRNAVILPKGCDYEWECTESGHFLFIDFDSELESRDILSFGIKNAEQLISIFKKTERALITKKPFYELECIRDLYSVIIKLCSDAHSVYVPSQKKHILAPSMDYIAENLSRDIKNSELADIAGISEVYFRKLFKEVYGTSPISYVKELRIKKAKEMLLSDHSSITDIAFSLGYKNIYDFSRDFKKHTGIPPSLYPKRSVM